MHFYLKSLITALFYYNKMVPNNIFQGLLCTKHHKTPQVLLNDFHFAILQMINSAHDTNFSLFEQSSQRRFA